MAPRALQWLQRIFLVAGVILLAACVVAMIEGAVSSTLALRAFDQARSAESAREVSSTIRTQGDPAVDFSLWSESRIRAYEKSLEIEKHLPLAVLSVDKLHMRVPVFEGTDELVLNRGVGWIVGTAKPGESGNIAIAGHRDGFFRGLKDIVVGDTVQLATLEDQAAYVVDQIEIVGPERVDVLRPRSSPSLTLVTCYPFYFIGSAPQRFIVHATLKQPASTNHVP